jgi:chromosome segregation ATPase
MPAVGVHRRHSAPVAADPRAHRLPDVTMSPAETTRKIRQLDSDVESIYEMLAAIAGTQTRHGNRLQEQAEKLDTLESKVDALDTKVSSLDTKVGSLETKVSSLETKVDSLQTSMDSVLEILRSR